jgi:hypothetical protein
MEIAMKHRRLNNNSTPPVVVCEWGAHGTGNGEFDCPTFIAIDCHQNIYVSDTDNHRIQRFTSDGKFICTWGSKGDGNGEFRYPHGLAIGVCDEKNVCVTNEMMKVPELYALPPGVLPICVAYHGTECIYVCDTFNTRMQMFGCDGTFIRIWDMKEIDVIKCKYSAHSGCLYVLSVYDQISVFDRNGAFIRKWGKDSLEISAFSICPEEGLLYTLGVVKRNIVVYTDDDTPVATWAFGASSCPQNILVTKENVYIVGYTTGMDPRPRIATFTKDGILLEDCWLRIESCFDMATSDSNIYVVVRGSKPRIVVLRIADK